MNLIDTIYRHYQSLLNQIPVSLHSEMLLTGGTAAFLYGSDRPYSNDIDVMIRQNYIADFESCLHVTFEDHLNKPIFQSHKAHVTIDACEYDLISSSVVHPPSGTASFSFYLTDTIIKEKQAIKRGGLICYCIPKEMLVCIKLLAGRGPNLKKYDLYDVACILNKQPSFNMQFFSSIVHQFCSPFSDSLPILKQNAAHIQQEYHCQAIQPIVSLIASYV